MHLNWLKVVDKNRWSRCMTWPLGVPYEVIIAAITKLKTKRIAVTRFLEHPFSSLAAFIQWADCLTREA